MTKDALASLFTGLLAALAGFFVTVNFVDWYFFRDVRQDATRGITDNFYGAGAGLAFGFVTTFVAFIWQRKRARTAEGKNLD